MEHGNSGKLISNQPYDESVEVHDSEDVASIYTPTPHTHGKTGSSHGNRKGRGLMAAANSSSDEFDEEEGEEQQRKAKEPMGRQPAGLLSPNQPMGRQPGLLGDNGGPPNEGAGPDEEEEESEEEEDSDDDEDDDDEDERGGGLEGAYHPADYANLPVSTEIKELFQYITRYTPQTVELDHKLKPFIPDFIPAVGDIDAFIKVPRPDGVTDSLGLLVLDEPCVKQSDPTVLSLWLSEDTKQHTTQVKKVSSVSNAQKNPRALDSWMDSISELHRSKAPATVHYSRSMPDIDSLMQEWPPLLEDLLGGSVGLPGADLDCDLRDYVDVVCGLLDIPVYKNHRVQSLHVLFTLYQEFKNSHHFKNTVT